MTEASKALPSVERLRWHCRRGMLELDYLLRDFLDQIYPVLSEVEQELFVALLDMEDRQIMAWLMGDGAPEDAGMRDIIVKMQGVYQS